MLINCLRKDENLLTIRDFINSTLNKELVDAIDNEMSVTQVSDEVAKKVQMITRQEGGEILRSYAADFAGQAPTDPTPQEKKYLTTLPSKQV
jgi:hypothetical protein